MDYIISGPLESGSVLDPFTLSVGVPYSSIVNLWNPRVCLDLFCWQNDKHEYADIKSLGYYFLAEPTGTFGITDIEPI